MSNIHNDADVAKDAAIGEHTKVWALAQIREGAVIGRECILGRASYVGPGVCIGDRVKIQNLVQVYDPAVIKDGAFLGPAVILTNDPYPRSLTTSGSLASPSDWTPVGVTVQEGASLGAGSICVAPVTIGRFALIGAGSVVVRDVPDFALAIGNPARQIGWVGRAGRRLEREEDGRWRCPATGTMHVEVNGSLEEVCG